MKLTGIRIPNRNIKTLADAAQLGKADEITSIDGYKRQKNGTVLVVKHTKGVGYVQVIKIVKEIAVEFNDSFVDHYHCNDKETYDGSVDRNQWNKCIDRVVRKNKIYSIIED